MKKILSIFLLFCLMIFPCNTVYGSVSAEGNWQSWSYKTYGDDTLYSGSMVGGALPYTCSLTNIYSANVTELWFTAVAQCNYNSLSKGDTIYATIEMNQTNRYRSFTITPYVFLDYTGNNEIGAVVLNNATASFSGTSIDFSATMPSDFDYNNYTITDLRCDFILSDISYKDGMGNNTFSIRFNSFKISDVQSNETGLLNSILEWLRGIFDKLTSGFNNIVSGLSSVASSIVSKLSDIKNDIVSKVQQVITDITSTLSSLGTNIYNWFLSLGDRIRDFFIPSAEFWSNYYDTWYVWLHYHFGGLFDALDTWTNSLNTLINALDFQQHTDFTVTVPHLVVQSYYGEVNFTILESRSYSFMTDILDQNWGSDWYDSYNNMLRMYNIANIAVITLLGINRLRAIYEKFIGAQSNYGDGF